MISDAQYWQSANDLKLYANGFYAALSSYTGFGSIGIYGDDADQGSDNMIYINYNTWMNGETIVPSTGGG